MKAESNGTLDVTKLKVSVAQAIGAILIAGSFFATQALTLYRIGQLEMKVDTLLHNKSATSVAFKENK